MARNKHPEVTINRILDTSMNLFLEKGYEKTTIQDIIDALGDLSKGALYHHFKSKEEIFNRALERLAIDSLPLSMMQQIEGANGLERLRTLSHVSANSDHQDIMIPLIPNLLEHPKLLAISIKSLTDQHNVDILASIVEDGIEDGSINCSQPKEAIEVLNILFNFYLNPVYYPGSQEEIRSRGKLVQSILEHIGLPILDDELLERLVQLTVKHELSRSKQ